MENPVIDWFSAGMHHIAQDEEWLEPALMARLANMPYTKRRGEARLGRWTAKVTIARALGLDPAPARLRDIAIVNARDGAPEAAIDGRPLDAVIAMTDRADWAVCAVAQGSRRIGCDLELVEPRSAAFVRDYFTPPEIESVARSPDPHARANLIWSAKESALKVLRTGLRRDSRSVSVELHDSVEEGWHRLTVTSSEGQRFPGWWIRYDSFLLTVVSEVEAPPPRSLEEPPPLSRARPGHSWMLSPFTPIGR